MSWRIRTPHGFHPHVGKNMVAVSVMGMSVESIEGTLVVPTLLSAISPIQSLVHRLRCLWEVSTRPGFYAAAHGMLGEN
jgi:hypothetical protein